jgi:prepilin-type processing-associated H-X9-DG protein
MYTSDYDERFPQDSFRWNGREVGWEEAVFLYIKDPYMYYCPVQPNLPQGESWRTTSPGSVPTSLGYGANHDYVFPPPPRPTVFEKQIKNPAATILLADQGDLRRGLFAPIAGGGRWAVPIGNVALRHKDGANFVFVDGHVKWMKAGDAWGKDDSLWDLK